MDKQEAKKIIQDTFNNPFDKKQYSSFINNLFNKIDSSKNFIYRGSYILDAFKPYIHTLERIGKYVDVNDKKIDVLTVHLKKESSLEWARTRQRNLIAHYLNGSRGGKLKDAALVAFYTDDPESWRFSLVKMEYTLTQSKTGKTGVKEELTPARRYSFLVGENEPNHTAQQQLIPLLQDDINNPTLSQLEEAFSIEKVTKEFFVEYKELYLQTKEAVDEIVKKDNIIREEFIKKNINTVNFSKKLLGQIVFLYFLQKKGWLGVASDKSWGEGDKGFLRTLFDKCVKENKNFFNEYLEILFYDTLNNPRQNEVDPSYSRFFDYRIPFLNGGLFEPIQGYNWEETDINLDNKIFKKILDTFNLFNFTVKEDEPLEKEVAIDPEMLGKVFENLLEVKDRKSKGSYYTPREIVHYMCQESLINYLYTETKIPEKDIKDFIHYGDFAVEYDAAKERGTKSYKYKLSENIRLNAKLIDKKLANIRICDPAVGSGAFLVGMMAEIVKARNMLTTYLEDKEDRNVYNFKRNAIQDSLYGVDIDPGAVEIAKLRLWLSLIVDEEDIKQIRPLPNLDYKIVQGNSLLGVEENVLNWKVFAKLEELKPLFFNETNVRKKQEHKEQIEELIDQITNGHKEFDFEVYFSEVFHEKHGFDVVIANPPYLKERNNKKIFEEVNNSPFGKKYHQGKMDYWYYFLHKAINIVHKKGIISYITSRYWLNSQGAKKLIERVKEELSFVNFVDIGKLKVFDNVAGQHMVAVYCKTTDINDFIYKKLENDLQDIDKDQDTNNVEIKMLKNSRIISENNEILLQDGLRIYKGIKKLSDVCDTSIGVQESPDKLSMKQVEKSRRKDVEVGQGVFVLTKKELSRLNLNNQEMLCIEQYLDPSDVFKYRINDENKKFLIYSDKEFKSKISKDRNYRHIKKHLDDYKEFITSSNKPYGLHRPRDRKFFDTPKIIFKNMFVNVGFSYDDKDNYYFGFSFSSIIQKDKNYNLKYILAILNSKFAENWFYKNGKKRGAGVDIGVEKLRLFPIKKVSSTNQQPFVTLVDRILVITKDDDYLHNSTKQTQVKEYERQIDYLVCKLYELTDEEIKIVENFKI